jgi:hypothetical protein
MIDQIEFNNLSDCDKWRYVRDLEERQAKLPPQWKPISEHSNEFGDGDRYLVALRIVCDGKTNWEFYNIYVQTDDEGVYFYHDDNGYEDAFDEWNWDDLEFYIKKVSVEEEKYIGDMR